MKLTFSRECRMLFFWYNALSAVNETHEPVKSFCWRALARQQPILYNIEKSQNSSGVRSETCVVEWVFFYIRAFRGVCECMWKYRSISSKSSAQLEIKDTIHEVKYGCLLLLVEVFIEAMNGLVMTLDQGRQKIFYVLGCSIMWAILPIREWKCQDIDKVSLH